MGVFQYLLAAFFIIPLIEIYLLIKVGSLIGALPTVLLVVFTAVLGAWLMRVQGLSTLERVRAMLMRGEVPAVEALEGVALLLGGALLLTPGFFTDTVGFLLLVPYLRRRLILGMLRRGVIKATGIYSGPDSPPRPGPHTIEGEYKREKD